MKVAVLGAGNIGSTLGRKWARAGHEVMFGVRNVDKPQVQALVAELGHRASAGTVGQAIGFGDVVVCAIPGVAMDEMIQAYAQALNGKIVIDPANRPDNTARNSLPTFTTYAPGAKVYRAFNNLGWQNFESPQFGDVQADLFYCGPAGDAKAAVEQLIADVGLRPVCVGDLNQIRLVDMMGLLWRALASGQGMGRHLAFKMLTRQS